MRDRSGTGWAAALMAGCLLAGQGGMPPAVAADMTARQIVQALQQTDAGVPLDVSGKDLGGLDLSGVDFKKARLAGADMFGVDLTGSDLSGADLTGVRLDRATLINANFSGANLEGATLMRPSNFTDFTFKAGEAPRFPGARLAGVRLIARLDGTDFRGADLTAVNFEREGNGDITVLPRTVLSRCDFTTATLARANLRGIDGTFARFAGASLAGADLAGADLSEADFTGADLSGANLAGADLYRANLAGARGLDTAHGLESVQNMQTVRR